MIIFDGSSGAALRMKALKEQLTKLPQLKIFSLVCQEDKPSMIYANLKKKDAESVGIGYEVRVVPINTPIQDLIEIIRGAGANTTVNGIIVQKPAKSLMPSDTWWTTVVSAIPPEKDVDGLTPQSRVMPATARAILEIFHDACRVLHKDAKTMTVVVVGRSDIVGLPVAEELRKECAVVHLVGRKELAENRGLVKEGEVVISATGQPNLLNANDFKLGVIIIDAGSPKPEIDPTNLDQIASYLSPVPGGVGPMTRVCLLENLLDL
ncbi:MAG: bifunctional 5,10-methylenetetrahydrofolate dehydrogenase/5,10-methenyltetrahydrofolate cyclohydrolase [Candidatus Pacebacteria bacterium]|nr:bifunctional 5,10-methylenetetrahydrofolate dehydrogenase/5,10-methenyltetrahydrofolate cyclohydrolase [Candidatus Paceibacterota bacterium]